MARAAMIADDRRTVVVFSGLPYSGKTALILRLQQGWPGEAIYVDSHFRDIVSEDEVCLERWLEENPRLVDRMIGHIRGSDRARIYVEVGIMRRSERDRLIQWCRSAGFHVVPVLLECASRDAVARRQRARAEQLAVKPEKLKIAIDLDELYGPISAAFDPIEADEGYHRVDTCQPIEASIAQISGLMQGADAPDSRHG
jgi:hypothetical protein